MIVICNGHKECPSEACKHKVPHEYDNTTGMDTCLGDCKLKKVQCVIYIPDFIKSEDMEI